MSQVSGKSKGKATGKGAKSTDEARRVAEQYNGRGNYRPSTPPPMDADTPRGMPSVPSEKAPVTPRSPGRHTPPLIGNLTPPLSQCTTPRAADLDPNAVGRDAFLQDITAKSQGLAEEKEQLEPGPYCSGACLLNSPIFSTVINLTIVVNAIQMGLELDRRPAAGSVEAEAFQVAELTATFIFFVECVIKIAIMRMYFFYSVANVLDLGVVAVSVADYVAYALDPDRETGKLAVVQVLRCVRLARLFRIVRFVRTLSELTVIVSALTDALKTILMMSIMLVIMIYCASIICVSLVGSDENLLSYSEDVRLSLSTGWTGFNPYQYFGTMPRSMYTLFTLFTLTDLGTVGRPMLEERPAFLIFLVAFVMFTTFGLANVILGIIVENTIERSKKLEELQSKTDLTQKLGYLKQLQDMLLRIDGDTNGVVTAREIEDGLADAATRELFTNIRVPRSFTATDVLTLLDDRGCGELTDDDFLLSFYRLIDDDPFELRCVQQCSVNFLKRSVRRIEQMVCEIATKQKIDVDKVDRKLREGKDPARVNMYAQLVTAAKAVAEGADASFDSHFGGGQEYDPSKCVAAQKATAPEVEEEASSEADAKLAASSIKKTDQHVQAIHEKMVEHGGKLENVIGTLAKLTSAIEQLQSASTKAPPATPAAVSQLLDTKTSEIVQAMQTKITALEERLTKSELLAQSKLLAAMQSNTEAHLFASSADDADGEAPRAVLEYRARARLIATALEYRAAVEDTQQKVDSAVPDDEYNVLMNSARSRRSHRQCM